MADPLGEKRAGRLIFLLAVLIYMLSAKGVLSVSDSEYSLQTAKSILEKGSVQISLPFQKEAGLSHLNMISKYGIGLPVLWLPYVFAAKHLSVWFHIQEAPLTSFLLSFYNVFFGAGTVTLFFYLNRLLGASMRRAIVSSFLLAFCTITWRYSVWDYSEAAQMFFLLLAIVSSFHNSKMSFLICPLSFGFLILLKLINVIFLPVIILYLWSQDGIKPGVRRFRAWVFMAIAGVIICMILGMNYYYRGHLWNFGYGFYESRFFMKNPFLALWTMLFSLQTGLFVYSPVLIISVLGYSEFFKIHRKKAMLFAGLIASGLIFYSNYEGYYDSWSWGPRYLVPLIPFYLVPFVVLRFKHSLVKMCFVLLVIGSISFQVLSVVQNNMEYTHIKLNMMWKKNGDRMPPNLIGNAILLKHKFIYRDNVYALSEFGIPSKQRVNTTQFEMHRGLNLWYLHLARHFNSPYFGWLCLLFIFPVGMCVRELRRIYLSADAW